VAATQRIFEARRGFGYLLEGIDWRAPQRTWRPQSAGYPAQSFHTWTHDAKVVMPKISEIRLVRCRDRGVLSA
jgi:hypothetical protein